MFLLQITGPGQLFCQTYGAIRERVLGEGEKFLVDNRYVVAFSSSLQYELVRSKLYGVQPEEIKALVFDSEFQLAYERGELTRDRKSTRLNSSHRL